MDELHAHGRVNSDHPQRVLERHWGRLVDVPPAKVDVSIVARLTRLLNDYTRLELLRPLLARRRESLLALAGVEHIPERADAELGPTQLALVLSVVPSNGPPTTGHGMGTSTLAA